MARKPKSEEVLFAGLPETSELFTTPIFKTGLTSLDQYVLNGGIRKAGWTEIYGKPQQGKSTLIMYFIARLQRLYPDQYVVLFDTEGTFDIDYAKSIGVIIPSSKVELAKTLRLHFITSAEEIVDSVVTYLQPENIANCSGIIIDSFAGSATESELADAVFHKGPKGYKTPMVADFARLMARANPKIVQLETLARQEGKDIPWKCYTNQARAKIGDAAPSHMRIKDSEAINTPGGFASKHYAKTRLFVKQQGLPKLDEYGDPMNVSIKIEAQRDAGGRPGKSTGDKIQHLEIFFAGGGYNRTLLGSSVDSAVRRRIIDLGGTWHSYKGVKAQGSANFIEALIKNPEVMQALLDEVAASSELPETLAEAAREAALEDTTFIPRGMSAPPTGILNVQGQAGS